MGSKIKITKEAKAYIDQLKGQGYVLMRTKGGHLTFQHPTTKKLITVRNHPGAWKGHGQKLGQLLSKRIRAHTF
jgi:predicted RNA binding protein YcfA (HicA-like mRNA interferase family)